MAGGIGDSATCGVGVATRLNGTGRLPLAVTWWSGFLIVVGVGASLATANSPWRSCFCPRWDGLTPPCMKHSLDPAAVGISYEFDPMYPPDATSLAAVITTGCAQAGEGEGEGDPVSPTGINGRFVSGFNPTRADGALDRFICGCDASLFPTPFHSLDLRRFLRLFGRSS